MAARRNNAATGWQAIGDVDRRGRQIAPQPQTTTTAGKAKKSPARCAESRVPCFAIAVFMFLLPMAAWLKTTVQTLDRAYPKSNVLRNLRVNNAQMRNPMARVRKPRRLVFPAVSRGGGRGRRWGRRQGETPLPRAGRPPAGASSCRSTFDRDVFQGQIDGLPAIDILGWIMPARSTVRPRSAPGCRNARVHAPSHGRSPAAAGCGARCRTGGPGRP